MAVLVWLAISSVVAMDRLRERETGARVQLVATQLADRLAHALRVGVPLTSLVGVEEMFDRVLRGDREIVAIELLGPDDRLLHGVGKTAQGSIRLFVPIRIDERTVAGVAVRYRLAGLGTRALEVILLLIAAVMAVTIFALEAARYALDTGWRQRDRIVLAMARDAVAGRYVALYMGAARRKFDLRPVGFGTALARLNEHHMRLRRVIESLRQTEPNAQRRRLLDRLLQQATGADVFASGAPHVVQNRAQAAHWRWLVLLCACASGGLRLLWPGEGTDLMAWSLTFQAVAQVAGWLSFVFIERRWPGCELRLLPLAPAVTGFGVLLSVAWQQGAGPWMAHALAGLAMGWLLALIGRVEAPPVVAGESARSPDEASERAADRGQIAARGLFAAAVIGAELLGPVLGLMIRETAGNLASASLFAFLSVAALVVAVGTYGTLIETVALRRTPDLVKVAWQPSSVSVLASGVLVGVLAGLLGAGEELAGRQGVAWTVVWWCCVGAGAGLAGLRLSGSGAAAARRVAVVAGVPGSALLFGLGTFAIASADLATIFLALALFGMAFGSWSVLLRQRALGHWLFAAASAAGFALEALCADSGFDVPSLTAGVLLALALCLSVAARRAEI